MHPASSRDFLNPIAAAVRADTDRRHRQRDRQAKKQGYEMVRRMKEQADVERLNIEHGYTKPQADAGVAVDAGLDTRRGHVGAGTSVDQR